MWRQLRKLEVRGMPRIGSGCLTGVSEPRIRSSGRFLQGLLPVAIGGLLGELQVAVQKKLA